MRKEFSAYIAAAKDIANRRGVVWHLNPAADGTLSPRSAWELSGMCGTPPPPNKLLSDLGTDSASLPHLNRRLQLAGKPLVEKVALSNAWQELIKAAVLEQIFLRGNKANHALMGVARPLRVLATCAVGVEPWDLTPDHVALARDVALEVQASGQLAAVVEGVVRHIIDHNQLANHSPLLPPSGRRTRKAGAEKVRRPDPRRDIVEPKNADKLPDERAFWELVRIVFTEPRRSFMDELRFAQAKVLILCGLRIGEVCMMPLDWKREREYVDLTGRPAGELGGISQSLTLRYFAEKRSLEDHDGTLLYPEIQHIPPLFEVMLQESLDRVVKLTSPLRDRLRDQVATGRILPEFEPGQLVPAVDLYPYLSGNPFICPDPHAAELVERYRQSFDVDVLLEIRERQKGLLRRGSDIRNEVRIYFAKIRRDREKSLPFRMQDGSPIFRSDYANGFFRVSDLEALLRDAMPTKLSDTDGFRSTDGSIAAADLLFLNPKRSLGEERNDGICDVTRYIGVGRVTPQDLMVSLGGRPGSGLSLFERYGVSEEDQNLAVNSHSFRHLQNSELFRLGIADTMITKRFGRKSVAQSYEYDHRSLAEELDAMDSPSDVRDMLGPKAQQAFKMITTGKVAGPLVDQFKQIQKISGDDDALSFLAAEADGFHTTPYGFCINSFTVDPCPKHLECFNGCRHLSVSNLPEHRKNLVRLEGQLRIAVDEIESRPSKSIGRDNQLKHALSRLENVKKALEIQGIGRPFPDGADLAAPVMYSPGAVIDE